MQMTEGARLREEWERKGSPPCDHPEVDREYWNWQFTGDRVCTTCGHLFIPDPPGWPEGKPRP